MSLSLKNIRLGARLKEEQLRTANFEVGPVYYIYRYIYIHINSTYIYMYLYLHIYIYTYLYIHINSTSHVPWSVTASPRHCRKHAYCAYFSRRADAHVLASARVFMHAHASVR